MSLHQIDFNRLQVYEAGALLLSCSHILTRAMKRRATFTSHFAPMRSESEAR